MNLKAKIVETEKREIAGARSSNRFSYQFHWAFLKILEMFENENDFMLIMEHHDDIIVLDNSVDPKWIDFYQIKTNTKKNVQYISCSILTKREKDKDGKTKDSFMEKLIDDFTRFRKETRSLNFVSNKGFNFKLTNGDSKEKNLIKLGELITEEFKLFKDNMCDKCNNIDCKEDCKQLISFQLSELDVNTYEDIILGKLINFLDKYGRGTIKDIKSVYNTLISEITRINNLEKKPETFKELIKLKSITKEKFNEYINDFRLNGLMSIEWSEMASALRQENYNEIEIINIKKQWNKYRVDILGNLEKTLNVIRNDIQDILLNSPEFNSLRDYINYVHSQLTSKDYYNSNLYSKEYFTVMVIVELNYD